MSEYIITTEQINWFCDHMDEYAPIPAKIAHLEPVVRCEDCKHYCIVDETYDCDPIRGCGFMYFKGKRINDDLQEPQDPNGFCAWGERDEFVTCKCGEEIEAFGRLQTCPSCGRTVMA